MQAKFLIAISVLCITGCNMSSKGIIVIEDVAKDTVIPINSRKNQSAGGIALYIKSNVNDTFLLQGHIKIPGGQVTDTLKPDFYGKTYNLKYTPYKANKGSVEIEYVILY